MSDRKYIDLEYFKQVTLGNDEFAKEVIAKLLGQTNIYIKAIEIALERESFMDVKKAVQQFKSSAMLVGANELVAAIRKIEMANIEKFDDNKPGIQQVMTDMGEFITEVEHLKTSIE